MRLKKFFSILFLSGVIFSSVLCAGCNNSSDPADNNERTEKEEQEDNDVNEDNNTKEDNNEKEDGDIKDDSNTKDDDDKKEDNDATEDNKVTVDDLVDAYLDVLYSSVDYTNEYSCELKSTYGEEYGNLEVSMFENLKYAYDADSEIFHQKGTLSYTYSPEDLGLDPENIIYESYIFPTDHSTRIQFIKDPESGEWINAGEFAVSKDADAYAVSSGNISENQDSYLLTVNLPASEMGLSLSSLLGIPDDCNVKSVITVDKETMKCTSFFMECNLDEINSSLPSGEMQISKMVVKMDHINYENVELTLPEELQENN